MTELRELTEDELDAVSGGNFAVAVVAGVLSNAIYDAIKSDRPAKGGILDSTMNMLNIPH
jgi:bacteriocin-like protein